MAGTKDIPMAKLAPAKAAHTGETPDWESIERDYRAGLLSVREIASSQGVSHTAIQNRAKRGGWERDLAAKVQAKADAKVAKAAVAKKLATATVATEREIIEANAEAIANVRLAHRQDIGRYRTLALKLLGELEHQTDKGDLYEQLFDLLTDPEGEGEDMSAAAKERQRRRREVFDRALSLSGRSDTMKKLADTLKTLVGLEREAFGLAAAGAETPPPADPFQGLAAADIARRIAFTLAQGLAQGAQKG